uniref:Bm8703, isoform b n=1 Tax=Brugia malayi TaxID=6279 RepID=A0A0J9Y9V1_BRUMA|nr:Bm8703, isoform b [Brugia malayi]
MDVLFMAHTSNTEVENCLETTTSESDDYFSSGNSNTTTSSASDSTSSRPVASTCNGTFSLGNLGYCDDPKDATIDEDYMPIELRGKIWKTNKILGEGGNFKVYLVTNDDGLHFAMRWSRRQDCSTDAFENDNERQIRTVSRMKLHTENAIRIKELIGHHPNIVKLIGFRKVNLFTQQIMEYVDGGDLYDFIERNYIRKKRRIGIAKVRSLFRDLLKAVKHIHDLHVAHMDIKVENCLLTRNRILKLTDFDHAKIFQPGKLMPGSVYATEAYAAPETFEKEYRPDYADIWACGIFLYFLLKSDVPWEIADRKRDNDYFTWCQTEHKANFFRFQKSCETVAEFLMKMLQNDVNERATIDEILAHQWLQQ